MDINLKNKYEEMVLNASIVKPEKPEPVPNARCGIMNSPFYHHNVPTSKTHYTNLADVINNRPFFCIYPQTYSPIGDYFMRHNSEPFYSPEEFDDPSPGSATIANMIDMNHHKIMWRLEKDEDIAFIIGVLERYMESMEVHSTNANISRYLKKVSSFLEVMYDMRAKLYVRKGEFDPHKKSIGDILRGLMGG